MSKRTIIGALLALLIIVEMSTCYPAGSQESDIGAEQEGIPDSKVENPEEPAYPEEPKDSPNFIKVVATAKATDSIENSPTANDENEGDDLEMEKEVDAGEFHEVSEGTELSAPFNDRHIEGIEATIKDIVREGEYIQPEGDLATQPQPPQDYKVSQEGHSRQYQSTFPSMNCPPHVRCTNAPRGVHCIEFQANLRAPTTTNELAHSDCCPIHSCSREDGSKFYHFGIEVDEVGIVPQALSTTYTESFGPGSSGFSSRSYSLPSNSQQNVPMGYYPRSRMSSALYFPPNEFSPAPSQNQFGQGPPFGFQANNAPGENTNRNMLNNMSVSASQSILLYPGFFPQFVGAAFTSQQPTNNFFPNGPPSAAAFGPVENSETDPEFPVDRIVRTVVAGPNSFSGVVGAQQSPYEWSASDDWSRMKRTASEDQASATNSNFQPASDGVIPGGYNY